MQPTDPAFLPADQRRQAIAEILARAVRRLQARVLLPNSGPLPDTEKPQDSGQNCLEVPGETRLSVHTG